MLFDKLCGLAERCFGEGVTRLLRKARLFHLPGKAEDILPSHYTDEQVEFMRERFFLPFPITAVEDAESCVLFENINSEELGIGVRRRVAEIVSVDVGDVLPGAQYLVTFSYLNEINVNNTGNLISGNAQLFFITDDKKVFMERKDLPESMVEAVTEHALNNSMRALEEIMLFNTPDRFILETSVVRPRKNHSKKVLRTGERPIYTILRPNAIRQQMHLPEPTGEKISRAPHDRRAHEKVLRSEFFKDARWKRIHIPAMWVGPSESEVGGKRYRVMLDL